MKILFITDLFPIASNNEPKTLSYFVNIWKQLGHEIDVIKPNFMLNSFLRNKKYLKDGEYHENGVRILNCNFITPFWFNIKNKLPKCFNLDSYDAVVSHMPSGTLFAYNLLKKNNKPFVASVHVSDIEVLTAPLYKFYFSSKLKRAYKRADLVSARSHVLANNITELFPQFGDKTFVAYSGIEEEFIEPTGLFLEKLDDLYRRKTLKIITVASLIKRKNIAAVLKALSMLKDVNWHYTVVGAGKEINSLKRIATQLQIRTNVTFLLNVPRDQVFEKLKKSNVFVMLSERETFGMAYLEAMATGNIVIGKKNDGIDGILQNAKNGFLVENEHELAALLNKMTTMDYSKLRDVYLESNSTIHSHSAEIAGLNYLTNIQNLVKNKEIKD